MINGFLSENKEQDEWGKLIHLLKDNELYGVIWRSSTKTELAKTLTVNTGSLAMSMPGVRTPAVIKVVQVGMNIKNRFIYKQNGRH